MGASAQAGFSPPDVCLGIASSVLDDGGWAGLTDAVTEAVRGRLDFFPDGVTAVLSDPALQDPSTNTGSVVDIWGISASGSAPQRERPIDPSGADCQRPGHAWTLAIRHDLLQATAERLLAGARRSADGAEPLVPTEAEAEIDVEFDLATRRIRTILDWSKPVAFFEVGGLCWIDDVLQVEGGTVVVHSTAARDVTLGGDAGCDLFGQFLDAQGAGARAAQLLPSVLVLADGDTLRLVVESIEVDQATLVFSGSVEWRS